MKNYEVIVFVNESGYDVRCRNDIDSKIGFHRERDDNGNLTGVIKNTIFETNETRYGYIVYSGPESKAKNFANLLKFGYKGNHVARYFPMSSGFDKYRSDLKASENIARTLEKYDVISVPNKFQGVE